MSDLSLGAQIGHKIMMQASRQFEGQFYRLVVRDGAKFQLMSSSRRCEY